MKLNGIIATVGSMALSASVFAGPNDFGGSKRSATNFSDFVTACDESGWAAKNAQKAPENVEISCTETSTFWEPAASENRTLSTSRRLDLSMDSDKYNVGGEGSDLSVQGQNVSCPVYQEVRETVSAKGRFTCEQLKTARAEMASKLATVTDVKQRSVTEGIFFCNSMIQNKRRIDAEAGKSTDRVLTGATKSYCDQQTIAVSPSPRLQEGSVAPSPRLQEK